MCKRWLDINEEVAYRKMLSCTNKVTVKIWENFYSKFNVKGRGRWRKQEYKENMKSLIGYCNIMYKQTTVLGYVEWGRTLQQPGVTRSAGLCDIALN
jgi:hypothetical protein